MSRSTLAALVCTTLMLFTATTVAAADFRAEVVALTNAERVKAGCGALTRHSALDSAAQGHAVDMGVHDYFSHTGRDGSSPWDRTGRAGYPSRSGQGENIAAGQADPVVVVRGWMSSTGHRKNLLNCKFKSIGVGYATSSTGPYRHFWVQNFGTV